MANTSINIRMDADLKRQFEAFCADMGMTMTTAFNVFARKAVREYRIPFEISGDVPNAETVEAIKEVKRMKANPSLGMRDFQRYAAESIFAGGTDHGRFSLLRRSDAGEP